MLAHGDGHALWHLALLFVAPGAIIVGLTRYDRARDARSCRGSSGSAGGHGGPRPRGRPPGDTRFLTAAACAGAGLIHIAVAPEHYAEEWFLGVFFGLLGLLQVAWSVAVLRHCRRDLLALGGVANAGAVSLWAYTRTAGTAAIGPVDVVAVALEMTVVVLVLVRIVRVTAALPAGIPPLSKGRGLTTPAPARGVSTRAPATGAAEAVTNSPASRPTGLWRTWRSCTGRCSAAGPRGPT